VEAGVFIFQGTGEEVLFNKQETTVIQKSTKQETDER
jgi:hypothetical protein